MALAGALSGFFSFIFRPGKKLDVSNLNNEWPYARKLCDIVHSGLVWPSKFSLFFSAGAVFFSHKILA